MTTSAPTRRGAAAGWWTAYVVMRAGWSVHVHDAHLVPASGPVILAANHAGFLDAPLLMGTSPRPIHCLTKKEMFRGPLGWFLRSIGQIPIDRSGPDRTALLRSAAVLDAGRVLVVYPEGRRGPGDFTDVRPGLAWFALRSGAPVVPVISLGTGVRGTTATAVPLPRARLDVVFGPTVVLQGGPVRSRVALAQASDHLRAALTAHHADVVRRFGRSATDQRAPVGKEKA
ncbi:MAG: lysophospholipid acyltransferase family protein [Jiangellaceae bacterium]